LAPLLFNQNVSALRNRDTEIGIVNVSGGSGVLSVCFFPGVSLLHLNTLARDRSSFLRVFFWGGFVCFRKENSFCELWEKFEKRSEKRMAEVEARPDDGQRTEQGGVEEGEIVSVETQADRPAEAPKKHPLEHAWTFWFDNPNGKQKQVAWGSSIRAVYTFSTVEDFWWYVSSPLLSLFLFFVSCSYLDFCLPVFVAIFLLLSLHCVHRKRLLLSFFPSCSLRTRRQLFCFPLILMLVRMCGMKC
jgi:hypothetical protein